MKFGLTPKEYDYIKETVVNPLEAAGARVWCFGSRARGDYKKFSDLDLMVEGGVNIGKTIGLIEEVTKSGNFPYKVDLVCLENFATEYLDSFECEKTAF